MGWSCNAEASHTLDAITKGCLEDSQSQNVFHVGGEKYFYEHSRREHEDGAITGSIYRFLPDDEHVRKSGTFRIEGDGRLSRGPAIFKTFIQKYRRPVMRIPTQYV